MGLQAKLQEELQTGAIQLDIQQRKIHETIEKNNELQVQLDSAKASLKDLTLSDESIISYNEEALKAHRLSVCNRHVYNCINMKTNNEIRKRMLL